MRVRDFVSHNNIVHRIAAVLAVKHGFVQGKKDKAREEHEGFRRFARRALIKRDLMDLSKHDVWPMACSLTEVLEIHGAKRRRVSPTGLEGTGRNTWWWLCRPSWNSRGVPEGVGGR